MTSFQQVASILHKLPISIVKMNFIKNIDGSYSISGSSFMNDPEYFTPIDTSFVYKPNLKYQELTPITFTPQYESYPQPFDYLACHLCGTQFKNRGDKSRHLKSVHTSRNPCEFCGKSLKISGRADAQVKHFTRCPKFVSLCKDQLDQLPELSKRAYHLLKYNLPVNHSTLKWTINKINEEGRNTPYRNPREQFPQAFLAE
eukprot:NODE_714_length_4512_cov_0.872876.p3 type:complete len:201 gc:universal NODE_714_length_4512_cov_0.872876:2770-2168(-)